MHVEVNDVNIKLYKLVEVTGNSEEFLREKAREANESGHILSVELPDEVVIQQNVFDVYETEAVDPRRLVCSYDKNHICEIHGVPSKYDLAHFPGKPCLDVDPLGVPKVDSAAGVACAYTKLLDHKGSVDYLCVIHSTPSKYNIGSHPGAACLTVDPDQP